MVRESKKFLNKTILRMKKRLSNFIKKFKKPTHLDGVIDGVIFGWVISNKDPKIEVSINGQKSVSLESFTNIIPSAEIHQEAYRFWIDLRKYQISENDELELFVNGKKIKGPLKLQKSLCFAKIDYFSGYECIGWAGSVFGEIPEIKAVIDEKIVEVDFEWFFREDFRRMNIMVPTGFRFKIPEDYLDGKPHKVTLINTLNNKILCKEKDFSFYVKNFYLDKADEDFIAGWIQVGDYPGPVDLDIFINNTKLATVRTEIIREDLEKEYGKGCYGFYYPISEEEKDLISKGESYSFYIANTNIKVTDSYKTVSVIDILEGLEKVAQSLRMEGDKILANYIKTGIDLIRKDIPVNTKKIYRDVGNVVDAVDFVEDIVDVIIPVYKSKEETVKCIESVLSAKTNIKYEIIVINDCSPEKDLTEVLRKYAMEKKITLIENKENLGFVKSVNLGMKLHKNRDVVLLNSDTLVPDYWLDRLKKAAYSSKNVATVTPMSNRATILSIPKPNFDNEIPSGFDYKKLDAICQEVNKGTVVDIPTAVGFCMYIKRECLNEIGYFDEERFDKGYGEENDFCLKASSIGWRHVACLDLFVEHHGSLSFGTEKPERVKKALQIINNLYPDYNLRIQKFIRKDPIAPYRNRIIKEILKEKYKKFALIVIHFWGGGSLKYCKDIAKSLSEEGVGSLFLLSANGKIHINLYEEDKSDKEYIGFSFNEYIPIKKVIEEIRDLSIIFVHFNQTIGFKDLDVFKIPEYLNIPYFVTIHDYFYICPRINLINSGGFFCGVPEIETCEQCLSQGELEKDLDLLFKKEFNSSIIKWRKYYGEILRNAKKVICPSETAKDFIEKVFQINNIDVLPHPERISSVICKPEKAQKIKIAIIGAIGPHKGYYQIQKLVEYSEKNKLPFEFIFIGYTVNNKNLEKHKNVIITGPYESFELPALIKIYKPHLALFLNIWPETYNYTLSEALQNGLYPVAYDIGALSERMRKLGIGTIIPFPSTTEKIAEILQEVSNSEFCSREVFINNEYKPILEDYYGINKEEI